MLIKGWFLFDLSFRNYCEFGFFFFIYLISMYFMLGRYILFSGVNYLLSCNFFCYFRFFVDNVGFIKSVVS